MQIIVFKLNDKSYGITTDIVEEISTKKKITNVPNSPSWIKGLINLRGDAITLINMYDLLAFDGEICYNNVIIVDNDGEQLGLMVQEIMEVITIDKKDIENIERSVEDGFLGVIKIDNEIINVIDIKTLISKKEG